MSDIRTIFDEMSRDQPPSAITRDSAVAAGRRARRKRTGFGIAGAAAALVAVAIGVAALPGQLRAASPGAQFGAPAPTNPSPSPTVEPPEAVAARLTAVVRTAAGQVRPDAQFLADPYYRDGQQPGPLQVLPPKRPTAQSSATASPPDLDWYEGYAIVVDAQGKGTISVHFAPSGSTAGLGAVPCVAYSTARSTCAPRTGPHGERLSVWTSNKVDGSLENAVNVYLADGSVVNVGAANFTMDPHAGATSRATPSFTIDQLVQLATSPGMSLEP
jgi:hypothetical protein